MAWAGVNSRRIRFFLLSMHLYPKLDLRRLLLLGALLVIGSTVIGTAWTRNWLGHREHGASALENLPPLVLWAWERPEDLRHLDSQQVAVAFLSRTIYLRGRETVVRPRFQPLQLPPDVSLIAVVRIESDHKQLPSPDQRQLDESAEAIVQMASQPRILGVQIDFDATLSEREFYRALIRKIRFRLPEATALSITALASWCLGDNWLESLPIDEAVPMLFRLGADANRFRAFVASGAPFPSNKCQHSVGVSTDEPLDLKQVTRRTYVFNPKPWSPTSISQLLKN